MSTKTDRNAVIRDRAARESCAAIARDFGLTRERVRQIVGKIDRCPKGCLTIKESAIIAGIHHDTVREMVRRGEVSSVKLGKCWFIKADGVLRPCALCGEPRGSRKQYCKPCSKEARRKAVNRYNWRRLHRRDDD